MNRMERLTAILLLLQDKPRTSEEIAGRFEVSKRTVLRDMQALSEMGMPIIAREGAGGGYSLPANFALDPLPFTANEAFLLMLALKAVNQLSDTPFALERESLMAKLRASLTEHLPEVDGILEKVFVEVPKRDERAPQLEALMQAARNGTWTRATYSSGGYASDQHILPRNIYSMNGLWYCQAYSHERGDYRVYRVDRIQCLGEPAENFRPYPVPDPQPYTHESNPEIVAKFTARGVSMAESDPHLGKHIVKDEDGSGSIQFRCPPSELDYFARFFASLGSQVEVESPEELRQRLLRLGQKLIERYQKR